MQGCEASGTSGLVVHARELRVLARCLAKDDAADLLQDTWVAALVAPTPPRRVGAWLRQVMRNEMRAGVRADRRRRAREQHVPHETCTPAIDDDIVQTELVLAMLEAVDALAEPYRGVVRARFFTDRTPTQIALDAGAPPATVRWQLHEGLRRVRECLDARYGDRRHWHGGALAIGAWPTDRAAKTTMITRVAAMKWFAGLSIVGGSATIVAAQWPAAAAAESTSEVATASARAAEQTRAVAPDPSPAFRASASAADEPDPRDPDAPHEPGLPCAGCQHDDGEPHRMMMQDNADLAAALAACEHLVPDDAGEGRFEIEVAVRGQAEGLGNVIESVSVTRGRKLPCVDADAALEDADAPNVVRFDAVAACIERSLAPSFVDALPADTTRAMVEVLRDDARAPQPDAPPLPKASSAIDGIDPQEAVDRFDLAGRGKSGAPVSIVECGGYDCSYCNKARQTTDELSDRYGEAIELHYLQMPLGMHPSGELTARAAVAAGLQGKFWAMHDALFDDAKLRSAASIVARAVELGMDGEKFARDLDAPSTAQTVADQRGVCMAAGAEGTPAFFINGDLVTGAQDISAFTAIIDDELD